MTGCICIKCHQRYESENPYYETLSDKPASYKINGALVVVCKRCQEQKSVYDVICPRCMRTRKEWVETAYAQSRDAWKINNRLVVACC